MAALHGTYYFVSGVWPLMHMRSFEAVTGAKTDRWLVRTTGALLAAWGAALLISARRPGGPSGDLALASAAAACVLAGADSWYVAQRRISRIYMLDAAAEAVLIAAWCAARARTASVPDGEDGCQPH